MIAAAAARVLAAPRARAALLVTAPLAGILLAFAPGGVGPAAARAAVVAAAIGAALVLVRRRGRVSPATALAVVACTPLSGGASLALVHVDGRRFLVGIGRAGVSLVADLGAAPVTP